MERKWTSEQRDAIESRGGTLLVSAAAGSGKTAVLVERVIGLITDREHPCDADRLLVVTFTNAAASEMRERVARRLSDMIEGDPLDINLQRQQMLLQNAHISTIHSFCLDLLRENFEKLDIPPDFRIADQNEADILRDDVLDGLLEEKYAEGMKSGGAFLELSRILCGGRDDRALAETILRMYEFTRSLADADGWLTSVFTMYDPAVPVDKTVWGGAAFEYVKKAIASMLKTHRRAILTINGDEQLQKAYAPAFESDVSQLERAASLAESRDWDGLRSAVTGFTYERLGTLRKFGDDALKEALKAERDGMKKALASLAGGVLCCGADDFSADMKRLRPVVKCLCDTVRELDRRFFAEKLSRGLLDFSDLEQLALRLLVEKGPDGPEVTKTALTTAERFDEVLVDEYQDTNPAQDMIFRAVSRRGENLFMVGDVKQSIYSFRQARPEIFTALAQRCAPYGGGVFPAKIVLGRNFRSRAGVTEAVNFVFSRLMSKELGGVDYGGGEALIPAARYFERSGADFALHIVDTAGNEDEDGAEIEARHIASEIKRLIDGGFEVQGENGPRKAKFRDFCILLRSMEGRAEKYARVLEAENVPVFADIASGYLTAYEVMVMVSLLRVLDNPLQDVPLASVLLSPVFGFTPDDVAEIRIGCREKPLYLALLELSKSGDARFDGFIALLQRLRALSAVLPADRLILRIYDETGFLSIFEAMPNGALRGANLRLLLDYARGYESAGWRGLSGFIRFIDRVDRRSGDLVPASNISENADVVRIMSIHKSKGLEFPVCFLAGLSKRFNKEDSLKPALFSPACGFGCMVRDEELNCRFTTLPREVARLESQKSALSEEMRVLYVAMTRAKEKLYAVITLKNREGTLKKAASMARAGAKLPAYEALSAQNPAELILAAAMKHPSCGLLRSESRFSGETAEDGGEWEVSVIEAARELKKGETDETPREKAPDEGEEKYLKENLEKIISFEYPHKKLSELPSKVSVSELAEKETAAYSAERVRPAFLEGDLMTPAEAGTALHAFMQYCSLKAVAENGGIKAEVERLVAQKYLLPEQGGAVSVKKVERFAHSALFRRIVSAQKLWREFRFNIEVPAKEIYKEADGTDAKILLQGMADLVFLEDGDAVLVDYKTDAVEAPGELIRRYKSQLDIYARAVNEILSVRVKNRYIYSFHLGTEIEV